MTPGRKAATIVTRRCHLRSLYLYAIDGDTPLAYTHPQILETTVFTRQVQAVMSAEEYRLLQMALVLRPDTGAVIPRSGGLRKLRWALPGRGKRGGARIIYYWQTHAGRIVLLYLYPKNVRSTMSPAELQALRAVVDEF